MEIWADTSLIINVGTLVACAFFIWRLSANIKELEMELKLHKEKLDAIEKLDLDNRMTEMATNLERVKKSQERIEKMMTK